MPTAAIILFWLALAAPSVSLLARAGATDADLDLLTAASGEWATWFLVAALAITPLLRLVPALGPVRPQRRAIGLAAFGTALVHLGLYIATMGDLGAILAELSAPGIWTGWLALALMLPLALTSSNAAMRALGSAWKRLQRLAYAAALLTFVHMALVHDGLRDALWLALPLLGLELTRLLPRRSLSTPTKAPA